MKEADSGINCRLLTIRLEISVVCIYVPLIREVPPDSCFRKMAGAILFTCACPSNSESRHFLSDK